MFMDDTDYVMYTSSTIPADGIRFGFSIDHVYVIIDVGDETYSAGVSHETFFGMVDRLKQFMKAI